MSELKVDKVSPRSGNYVALNTVGMKNIIINGDMSIAQRGTTLQATQHQIIWLIGLLKYKWSNRYLDKWTIN
jgi:hypothetical protein